MSASPQPDEDLKQAVDDVFTALRNQAKIPRVAQLGSGGHIEDHNTAVGALINLDERTANLQRQMDHTRRIILGLAAADLLLVAAIVLILIRLS